MSGHRGDFAAADTAEQAKAAAAAYMQRMISSDAIDDYSIAIFLAKKSWPDPTSAVRTLLKAWHLDRPGSLWSPGFAFTARHTRNDTKAVLRKILKESPETVVELLHQDSRLPRREQLLLPMLSYLGADAIPVYIWMLKDDELKSYAARELAASRSKVVPALLQAYGDDELKSEAVAVLKTICPVRQLLDALRTDEIRTAAAVVLSALGKAAVPDLISALKDDRYREVAVEHLVKIGKEAVPDLIQALKKDELRGPAAEVLGRIGKPAMLPLLERYSQSSVHGAFREMGEQGVRVLITQLQYEKRRFRAVIILREIGSAAVPALIESLEHDDFVVSEGAAVTLGYIGGDARRALPALSRASRKTSRRTTKEAIRWARRRIRSDGQSPKRRDPVLYPQSRKR